MAMMSTEEIPRKIFKLLADQTQLSADTYCMAVLINVSLCISLFKVPGDWECQEGICVLGVGTRRGGREGGRRPTAWLGQHGECEPSEMWVAAR